MESRPLDGRYIVKDCGKKYDVVGFLAWFNSGIFADLASVICFKNHGHVRMCDINGFVLMHRCTLASP